MWFARDGVTRVNLTGNTATCSSCQAACTPHPDCYYFAWSNGRKAAYDDANPCASRDLAPPPPPPPPLGPGLGLEVGLPQGPTLTRVNIRTATAQNMCVTIPGGSVPGQVLVQSTCVGGDSQTFLLTRTSATGWYWLRSTSGLCVGVRASGGPGSDALPWSCIDLDDQVSAITDAGSGWINLRPRHNPRLCLEVQNGRRQSGARILAQTCNGGAAQRYD